jgi:hypothetical protein
MFSQQILSNSVSSTLALSAASKNFPSMPKALWMGYNRLVVKDKRIL